MLFEYLTFNSSLDYNNIQQFIKQIQSKSKVAIPNEDLTKLKILQQSFGNKLSDLEQRLKKSEEILKSTVLSKVVRLFFLFIRFSIQPSPSHSEIHSF